MIKTLKNTFKQDKEKFAIPSSVQQAIPIQAIWQDGIFQVAETSFQKHLNSQTLIMRLRAEKIKKQCFLSTVSF